MHVISSDLLHCVTQLFHYDALTEIHDGKGFVDDHSISLSQILTVEYTGSFTSNETNLCGVLSSGAKR